MLRCSSRGESCRSLRAKRSTRNHATASPLGGATSTRSVCSAFSKKRISVGADVEDLNDALGVGGDAGEVGAVEDRALQRAGLKRGLFGLLARGVVGGLGEVDPCPRFVVSNSDDVAPSTCARPTHRMDYETSKRHCKQLFKGILQLIFSVGLLQETCALDKEGFHFGVN